MAAIEMRLPELEGERKHHDTSKVKIFTGRANPQLAGEIASYLGTTLSELEVKNFADGETYVRIKESVRGHDVFVIGVGVIAGRTGGLGENVESALSRVVLLIALPAPIPRPGS